MNSCAKQPVSLTNLSATLQNNILAVNWTSEHESNNAFYIVEISKNAQDFFEAGRVNSLAVDGNSTVPLKYSFSHTISEQSFTMSVANVIWALLLMLFFGTFFIPKKQTKLLSLLLLVGFGFSIFNVACSKNEVKNDTTTTTIDKVFVRIIQTDKDGRTEKSTIMEATKK